jgi:hypothetical protein
MIIFARNCVYFKLIHNCKPMKTTNRLIIIPILLGFGLLFNSCQALKKSICNTDEPCAYVSIERRDTIPIFKGTKIFVGSSTDSISMYDSMRYYQFELMNYGNVDYIPYEEKHLNMIFDLEINGVIYHSDTTMISPIAAGKSRYYTAKFPVKWFISGKKTASWNYSDIDLPYHYRVAIKDQDWKTVDMFFPRTLNEKPPVKKYDEVTKDTVMYWVRPIVKDTTITVYKVGYAFKDKLIFIDDIIGCNVYAHTFFGNKIYNFTVDTCMKVICSKETVNNNETEAVSALVVKAWPDANTSKMNIYVNDTLVDIDSYNTNDSLFVCLIAKPFNIVKSVELKSNGNWTVEKVYINNTNLLNNTSTIEVKGIVKIDSIYKVTATK